MKIKTRKFTMNFPRRFIVCASSIFFCWEIPYKRVFFSMADASTPTTAILPISGLIPKDSLESAGVSLSFANVPAVTDVRSRTKIFSAVVQSIAVYMISKLSIFAPKDFFVHVDKSTFGYAEKSDRIKLPTGMAMGLPIPLTKPFKIFNANNSVLSLSKWNKSIGLINRLDHFMSLNINPFLGFVRFMRSHQNRLYAMHP